MSSRRRHVIYPPSRLVFWLIFGLAMICFRFSVTTAWAATCGFRCTDGFVPGHPANISACESDGDDGCHHRCVGECGSHGGCFDWRCGSAVPDLPGGHCAVLAATAEHGGAAAKTTLAGFQSRGLISTMACEALPAIAADRCVAGDNCAAGSFCCMPVTPAAPGGAAGDATTAQDTCGTRVARINRTEARRLEHDSNIPSTQWSCQHTTGLSSADLTAKCAHVVGACPNCDADVKCCIPNSGPSMAGQCRADQPSGSKTSGASVGGGGSSGGLHLLPPCVANGDCNIADIVNTGVNFANALMALSGGIFLAIFVFAGFKYVLFAYDSGQASEAKKMLVNASVGMLLILGSSVFVRFVHQSLVPGDRCIQNKGPSYSCQDTQSFTAASKRACARGLCGGSSRTMCCPLDASAAGGGLGNVDTPGVDPAAKKVPTPTAP